MSTLRLLFVLSVLSVLSSAQAAEAQPRLPDPNSYEAMGWILAVIGGILTILLLAITLWQKLVPRRTPALEAEFASKEELKSHRENTDQRMAKMSSDSAAGREKIYNKIDVINAALASIGHQVSSLTTADEHLNSHLIRLETKLDNILQRLPPLPPR